MLALISCLAGLSQLTAIPSAGAAPANDPLAAVAYQENPAHDGHYSDATFGPTLRRAWSVGLGVTGGPFGYPLIADGVVYDTLPEAGEIDVEAFSLQTGDIVWGPKTMSSTYTKSYLAYDNGQLFALTYNGTLTAYDATDGDRNWVIQLPRAWNVTAPPTATGGVVYASAFGEGTGTLYAIDETTGQLTWTVPFEGGDSSPTVGDGGVFVAAACNQVYRFGLDGQPVWEHPGSCQGGGGGTAVLHDGEVYTQDSTGDVVLDAATGTLLDTYASSEPPAFDGDNMATESGGVLSVWDTTTDTRLWKTSISDPTGPEYVTAPVIANGYVVEGRSDGTVEMRDEQTGRIAWSGATGSEYTYVDAVSVGDGAVVVPNESRLTVFLNGTADPAVWIVDGPPSLGTVGPAPSFTFASTVPGATYECTLDDDSAPCTSPVTYSGLSNGYHHFSVALAGTTVHSDTSDFYTDATVPSVWITQGPSQHEVIGREATFGFEWNRRDSTFECTLDGTTSSCTTPITYRGLSGGEHTFSVAMDGTSATSERRSFVVDAAGPVVRLHRFHPTVTRRSKATTHWSAADPSGIGGYEVRVRQSRRGNHLPMWGPGSSTREDSVTVHLRPDSHLCLAVRAEDDLGNWSAWSTEQCVVRHARPHRR